MKQIPLTQGQFALVDDEDYEYLIQWKWCAKQRVGTNVFYATTKESIKGKPAGYKRKMLYMHRVILGVADSNVLCDHKNGNPLDNRRCNLRTCTASQNIMNVRLTSRNTSGFKGVFWNKNLHKWRVQIVANKKQIHIGHFQKKEEAAAAYAVAAEKYHGEYANTGR